MPPPDQLIIRDLEVFYHVGVPDDERAQTQRLLLTIEMEGDWRTAAADDDLTQTIDYFAVSRLLLRFGEGRSWKLIETLAVDLAEAIRAGFKVPAVVVEVKKFILPEARYVAVRIRRP
jgi:7,8-dihydroneopterin aldolase/epimerase/oxygenase